MALLRVSWSNGVGRAASAGFIIAGVVEARNWHTTPDGGFDSGYVISAVEEGKEKEGRWLVNAVLVTE